MVKDYRKDGIGQSPELNAIDKRAAERDLIKRIQDALGTGETGAGLVEVARNAARAESKLAAVMRAYDNDDLKAVCKLLSGD